jgi:predicted P-loop ATPase
VHELAPGLSTSQDIDVSRDGLMALAKNWFVEFAEMVSTEGRNDRIRGFITRRIDEFRSPYAREVVPRPRQCIFIGTTNDKLPIKDEVGMRRYWPVTITNKIDIATMRAEIRQVWAEAKARYEAGEKWWFDESEEELISSEVSLYVEKDIYQEAIERAVLLVPPAKRKRHYTILEILDLLGIDPSTLSHSNRVRIGMALSTMGFGIARVINGSARQRVYTTPPYLLSAGAIATGAQTPAANMHPVRE